jgi:methyl-accepting chemotaxis protein
MASNLTNQVRGIAKVVTAVATGNLKQKLSIVSRGEVAQLTDTINEMIDTLALFADQVTTVAREVGVEGRLGGQALVPGASGIWKRPYGEREPAGGKPYHAGTCDLRGGIGGNQR